MPFYREAPFSELAADRRIKEISGSMLKGTMTQSDYIEAQRLIAQRAENLVRLPSVKPIAEKYRAIRREELREALQRATGAPAEKGVVCTVVNAVRRTFGLGS